MNCNEKFSEQLDTLKNLRNIAEEAEADLYDFFDNNFESIIKEYQSKLKSPAWIEWKQYTPSFNDGDNCLFGVDCSVYEEGKSYPRSDLGKEIHAFINKNADCLEGKYGDGFKITVNDDGINIEEYYDYDW